MNFTRLRLSGFKSFVEPADVAIEPGLTGIVGPNGCGKSNLVEALRWVMGETSARKMRGGMMDDVIFAGTATRPSRNLAEVTLELDNRDRRAPAPFNDATEIEVTRRIARAEGSAYRVNGREVRARDVQLLFADLATGAQSTAMVSQGRVGALINAKPVERRHLLEEAAGITGLHSRRHEAELRLGAAESNLERLGDVTQQLEAQLQGLKRQARQASRYRNISGDIRRAEAIAFHLRHLAAAEALRAAAARLALAEQQVAERTMAASATGTREAAAAETLPPLRQAEAEAAAALHRLAVARDGLQAEEQRAREQQAALGRRIEQIDADLAREQEQARDAAAALARLGDEAAALAAAGAAEAALDQAAAARVAAAQAAVAERQQALDALTERAAAEAARRNSLAQQLHELEQRRARLAGRQSEIEREQAALAAQGETQAQAEAVASEVQQRVAAAEAARERLDRAEAARLDAVAAESAAREAWQEVLHQAGRLEAEEKGLAKLLAVHDGELWPPLIDALTVAPGYEVALGAALGDELNMPADTAAPVHWQTLPPLPQAPELPAGAEPLARNVTAPPALARRLAQIGVVADADGPLLVASLAQGQRLVSREGGLWRWDGFVARAGAPTAAAVRLEQRNRLADLRLELDRAADRREAARAVFEQAQSERQSGDAALGEMRGQSRQAEAALVAARDRQAAAVQRSVARASRLAALASSAEQIATDLAEAAARCTELTGELAGLPEEALLRAEIVQSRGALEELRAELGEARSALDLLRREAAARARRIQDMAQERRAWTARGEGAERQIAALGERRAQAAAELAAMRDLPGRIAAERAALLDRIAGAEAARNAAADALALAEQAQAECAKAARAAQSALAEARETRVREQADTEHAAAGLEELAQRLREALDCEPDAALQAGGVAAGERLPEPAAIELRLERLRKERDGMGPVNLRAELEAEEVEAQLAALLAERADLEAAIQRLRQGIASLNREGRERLAAAFEAVNQHFAALFAKVFGGGQAHLKLTESDDPLEAGLEIMASPPGKKLQVMSLLSGGEQALTALSLLFAVFLTNPAPICVLDEVDAPLDDTNVERLCDLLDSMAESGQTRFLVVTHHPITMARMDRLYGVTMAERGVSQLVSVDLAAAEALRQTA